LAKEDLKYPKETLTLRQAYCLSDVRKQPDQRELIEHTLLDTVLSSLLTQVPASNKSPSQQKEKVMKKSITISAFILVLEFATSEKAKTEKCSK